MCFARTPSARRAVARSPWLTAYLYTSSRERWSRYWPIGTIVVLVRKLCERPGCAGLAEVSYGIDKAQLLVWVDNRVVPDRELAGRLCRRHADALSVPRGWTIDDRRDAIPKLFRVSDDPQPPAVTRTKRVSAKKPERERPSLFEGNPDPDETQAIPWSPRLAKTVQSDDDQPVFGRLLGRAFGQEPKEDE